jgi:hypothetical protein
MREACEKVSTEVSKVSVLLEGGNLKNKSIRKSKVGFSLPSDTSFPWTKPVVARARVG